MSSAQNTSLKLQQTQKQVQRLSQVQITALNYLAMGNEALKDEIYRAVSDNPALEIVREPVISDYRRTDSYSSNYGSTQTSDQYQTLL